MRIIFCLIAAILLAACNKSSNQPQSIPINPVLSPSWSYEYSTGTYAIVSYGSDGFTFTFPPANGVHYVTKAGSPFSSVTVNGRVQGSGTLTRLDTCSGNNEARIYFQRSGDNWSGSGDYQFYRWWYTRPIVLTPGTSFSLVATTADLANWGSVLGIKADAAPSQFATAVANIGRIGITFGGGCSYGHGVWAASGNVAFTVDSWVMK